MPGLVVFSMFPLLLLSLVAPGLQEQDRAGQDRAGQDRDETGRDEKDIFSFPKGYDVSQDDDNYV